MKFSTTTTAFIVNSLALLSASLLETANGATLRGGNNQRELSYTTYDNMRVCAYAAGDDEMKNDKYFWMTLVDPNNNNKVQGQCLLKIPKGAFRGALFF